MKTKLLIIAMLATALVNAPATARADEMKDLEKSVAALDAAGKTPEDHTRVLERIAKQTGTPVETLKDQKARSDLGFGGVFIANALAKETGQTFDALVALHKSGMGWGLIAKDNNVKLGPIVSQAKAMEKVAKLDKKPDKRSGSGAPDREVGKHDSDLGKKPSAPNTTRPKTAPRGGDNGGGRGK